MNNDKRNPVICPNCKAFLRSDARFCSQCGEPVSVDIEEDTKHQLSDNDSLFETSGAKGNDLPKLYSVYSIVNNFRYMDNHYDNLKIIWFVVGRDTPQVPFEKVITEYSILSIAARVSPENHIKEKFTREEADLLKKFLTSMQRIEVIIEEKLLPIGKNESGYHDVPPPKGTDFFPLYKNQRYNLPFKVEGIFNIKMADARIGPDEQITVISKIPPEFLRK